MYHVVAPTGLSPVRLCPLVSVPAVGHGRLPATSRWFIMTYSLLAPGMPDDSHSHPQCSTPNKERKKGDERAVRQTYFIISHLNFILWIRPQSGTDRRQTDSSAYAVVIAIVNLDAAVETARARGTRAAIVPGRPGIQMVSASEMEMGMSSVPRMLDRVGIRRPNLRRYLDTRTVPPTKSVGIAKGKKSKGVNLMPESS